MPYAGAGAGRPDVASNTVGLLQKSTACVDPKEFFDLSKKLDYAVKNADGATLSKCNAAMFMVKTLENHLDIVYQDSISFLIDVLHLLATKRVFPREAVKEWKLIPLMLRTLSMFPDAIRVQSFGISLLGSIASSSPDDFDCLVTVQILFTAMSLLKKTGAVDRKTFESSLYALVFGSGSCLSALRFNDETLPAVVPVAKKLLCKTEQVMSETQDSGVLNASSYLLFIIVSRIVMCSDVDIFRSIDRALRFTISSMTRDVDPRTTNSSVKNLLKCILSKEEGNPQHLSEVLCALSPNARTVLETDAVCGCRAAQDCVDLIDKYSDIVFVDFPLLP